jgi:hypothetical protein
MKVRTTVVLDQDVLARLRELAERRDTTVTGLVREAVARYLTDDQPNDGLHALVGIGASGGGHPPVDSDAAKAALGDALAAGLDRRVPPKADVGLPDDDAESHSAATRIAADNEPSRG